VDRLLHWLADALGLSFRLPDDVVIVGDSPRLGTDLYHAFLRARWPASLLAIVVFFLAVNVVFAGVYTVTGGIENAREGSFADAFFFSVHTMATIGYGSMYPATPLTNVLVVVEAVVGLLVTALSTGLLFAKFSTPTSRIEFSRHAVISPVNGVPTLAVRIGNRRGNFVVNADITLVLTRTVRTTEGVVQYQNLDLVLVRARAPALARTWNVAHRIDETSPLHGLGPADCEAQEIELGISVTGVDETTVQPVLARHRYLTKELLFGARFADALRELPDGRLELDVRKFDVVVSTEPTATFPHRHREEAP
jgi:inward rectifier potassium channel